MLLGSCLRFGLVGNQVLTLGDWCVKINGINVWSKSSSEYLLGGMNQEKVLMRESLIMMR